MAESAITPDQTPNNGAGGHTSSGDTRAGAGDTKPEYIAFGLVPFFFLLGLLGVLICHILKRKGYRCTTQEPGEDGTEEEVEDKDPELGGDFNDTISENNDTVGQIVHMIMRNEANTDALKAMVMQNSFDSDAPPLTPTSPTPSTPPMTPVSPVSPGIPGVGSNKHTCSHLHTVGGPGGLSNTCNRCSQKKWPLMRRPSPRRATELRRSQQGPVTVLAVGRFRVTKCEKQPPRERRTLLLSEGNGSAPSSPVEAEPKSRTTSQSQQEPT